MEQSETANKKKYFFGWTNIKWFLRELLNLLSGKPSFFSLKRVDRVCLMVVALGAYVYYFITHIPTMDGYTFVFVVTKLHKESPLHLSL